MGVETELDLEYLAVLARPFFSGNLGIPRVNLKCVANQWKARSARNPLVLVRAMKKSTVKEVVQQAQGGAEENKGMSRQQKVHCWSLI